ncbi:Cro/CI family transcriptional regulator [Pantoea ananatis]
MKTITLKEFAEEVSQAKAAIKLGVRQSAISKAIRAGRNVTVSIFSDGSVKAQETKDFPCMRRDAEDYTRVSE